MELSRTRLDLFFSEEEVSRRTARPDRRFDRLRLARGIDGGAVVMPRERDKEQPTDAEFPRQTHPPAHTPSLRY
jgi:hypothetical protein